MAQVLQKKKRIENAYNYKLVYNVHKHIHTHAIVYLTEIAGATVLSGD